MVWVVLRSREKRKQRKGVVKRETVRVVHCPTYFLVRTSFDEYHGLRMRYESVVQRF